MASRVLSRRQFSRDLPRAYALLSCAAFGMTLLIFLSHYWSQVPRDSTVTVQLNDTDNDKRYAGSIMIDPPRGEMCWERIFDNRTGNMRENGYVKCNNAPLQLSDDNQPHGLGVNRLNEIGKTFRHKSD
jgi:hypothetical protein